jgi:hypothetical protein
VVFGFTCFAQFVDLWRDSVDIFDDTEGFCQFWMLNPFICEFWRRSSVVVVIVVVIAIVVVACVVIVACVVHLASCCGAWM